VGGGLYIQAGVRRSDLIGAVSRLPPHAVGSLGHRIAGEKVKLGGASRDAVVVQLAMLNFGVTPSASYLNPTWSDLHETSTRRKPSTSSTTSAFTVCTRGAWLAVHPAVKGSRQF
jgi:hypothetical protein